MLENHLRKERLNNYSWEAVSVNLFSSWFRVRAPRRILQICWQDNGSNRWMCKLIGLFFINSLSYLQDIKSRRIYLMTNFMKVVDINMVSVCLLCVSSDCIYRRCIECEHSFQTVKRLSFYSFVLLDWREMIRTNLFIMSFFNGSCLFAILAK